MKKVLIRNGVFETNSSSCHSISISDETQPFVFDTIYPDLDGKITIKGGEYGRGVFTRHNDVKTKLSYALTSTLYGVDENMLREIIQEQTGCDNIELLVSEDYNSPYFSHIDHDSVDTVPRTKEELRNFIFNKNSWLFIAHDEGTPPPDFYDALPLYLENGEVLEPQYKFIFEVPSLDIQYKFLDFPNEEQLFDMVRSIDVRYNATKGVVETDYNYWSGEEIYYERDYYYPVDLERKLIILVNDDAFYKEYEKRMVKNNKILPWGERDKLRKNIIKYNIDNEDMIYSITFTITKI